MPPKLPKVEYGVFASALDDLGICKGDNLFIHSDLLRLGYPIDGLSMYLDIIKQKIGTTGSLFAPTFTFSFLKKNKYDFKLTKPINMGFLSDQLLSIPNSKRSKHPINSIVMNGPLTDVVSSIETPSAYSSVGIFARLLDFDIKIVLLGARPNHISYSHFSEEKFLVPYRSFLSITGRIKFSETDQRENCVFQFFARDLKIDHQLGGYDVLVNELVKQKKWKAAHLPGCTLYCGAAFNYVQNLDSKLEQNPFWLVENARIT
jgi:aminoglycoside 3-N-acetyltransferase